MRRRSQVGTWPKNRKWQKTHVPPMNQGGIMGWGPCAHLKIQRP
jgi:hypothetical protein